MTAIIYEVHNPTEIDLEQLGSTRIVWIFDIDETLVRHDKGEEQEPIAEGLADWVNELLTTRHEDAICFLTARMDPTTSYPYDRKPEKELLRKLGIADTKITGQLTLNNNVSLFNYTAGNLKGVPFFDIVSAYQKFGYARFHFLEDRLTQIDSVHKNCCGNSQCDKFSTVVRGVRARSSSLCDYSQGRDQGRDQNQPKLVRGIRARRSSASDDSSCQSAVVGTSCNNGFSSQGHRSTITSFWVSSLSNEKHLARKYRISRWHNPLLVNRKSAVAP